MEQAGQRVSRDGGQRVGFARVMAMALLAFAPVLAEPNPGAPEGESGAEQGVRGLIDSYERAIETKDLDLFRSVKPNLSADEERRLEVAFQSTGSHEVLIKIVSIEIDGEKAVAQIARRDTLEGSIVSSFPQTLSLTRGPEGWVIEQIGR